MSTPRIKLLDQRVTQHLQRQGFGGREANRAGKAPDDMVDFLKAHQATMDCRTISLKRGGWFSCPSCPRGVFKARHGCRTLEQGQGCRNIKSQTRTRLFGLYPQYPFEHPLQLPN